jgi:hypothetical protein
VIRAARQLPQRKITLMPRVQTRASQRSIKAICKEHRSEFDVAPSQAEQRSADRGEKLMATKENDQIVETPVEARQAESGPSIFMLLTISTGLAVLILGLVWFIFFH